METSIFLAKVIGLVSVISTVAILLRYKQSLALEQAAARIPGMTYLSGFVFLLLGVLLVVSHSVWVWDWPIVITIIGWLVLLKGMGRIFFPDAVGRMIERKQKNQKFILGEVAVFLVGLYLLYYSFLAP
jgi:threonine/homoserine/homoserine lactone efflux protein